MKIKFGNSVFLQKYEIAHIHNMETIPACILQEFFFERGRRVFIMNGTTDGFTFDCEFKNEDSINWLMSQDWIVDFDEYSAKSESELMEINKQIVDETEKLIDDFNNRQDPDKDEEYESVIETLNQNSHKVNSIKVVIAWKRNGVKFVFPKGYNAPA